MSRAARIVRDLRPAGYIEDWRRWLVDEDERSPHSLRVNTGTGWACGATAFVKQVEALIGRPAQGGKRGRKPTVRQGDRKKGPWGC